MALSERSQRGLEVLGEFLGERARAAATESLSSAEFGHELTRLGVEIAFADVWDRPGLDRRLRSLVVLGILMARNAAAELRNHFRIGLRNGLTPRELEEAVIQSVPYAGLPSASPAMSLLVEVLREQKIGIQTRTVEERGLL
jgi:4-carboxymuconolactone decarboxylase